ncbi:Small GTPase superfamilyRas type [Penicillium sp. IBT 31633x]|nr:Small GTPase superfamilyRas type [Penicillium sp. IBT 31633x]
MPAAPKQRKIAIVGSRSVGKSSLTVRFVEHHFVESYYPTIENTFSRIIKHNGQDFATEIVDTAGQDEYSILNSKHFIGIHGYIIVYSVTSRQSFEMVRVIRDKILNHLVSRPLLPWLKLKNADTNSYLQGADDVPLVIVGNKSDLKPEHRQVTTDDGRQLAEELGCAFTEASAFLDFNVSKAFDLMIGEVEKSQNPSQPTGNNKCTLM